jgi:two-component system, NarL family, nitrate/nitrite response regulator NarL
MATSSAENHIRSVGLRVDNELLRQGMRALLGRIPGIEVVQVHPDRSDVQLPPPTLPDVLIVTPAEHSWTEELLRDRPSRPQVLLLVHQAQVRAPETFAEGPVDGVLLQEELSTEILADAISRLGIGQAPIPAQMVRTLLGRSTGTRGSTPAFTGRVALTAREMETLELLAAGMSNKQIARALSVSSHGAKRLVGSVLMKLGAPNRTAAVVNAFKEGLVDPP